MESRRLFVIIGLIIFGFGLLACSRQENPAGQPISVQPVSGPQPEFMNIFSKDCPEGQFAVFENANATGTPRCEPPRDCAQTSDCAYLEIDQLPPRVGYCENGTCAAACGSGIIRPCR
jgi:hypothetical protein